MFKPTRKIPAKIDFDLLFKKNRPKIVVVKMCTRKIPKKDNKAFLSNESNLKSMSTKAKPTPIKKALKRIFVCTFYYFFDCCRKKQKSHCRFN
jgi:hypothetical protein